VRFFGNFYNLFSDLICLEFHSDSLKTKVWQVLHNRSAKGNFEGDESIYVVKKPI